VAIDSDRVISKIETIVSNIDKLKRFQFISLTEYLSNEDWMDLSHLYMQLIFQAAIDANEHILKESFQVTAKSYQDTFIQMGEYKVLTAELVDMIADSAKLRNVLVHQYDKINYTILFGAIGRTLAEYPIYIDQITNYIESLENKDNG
jgi:uncharacterized protein YutE (UPF0331/DUF86 family)